MPREFSERRERWSPRENRESHESHEKEERPERIKEILGDAIRELEHKESVEKKLKESIEGLRELESQADRTEVLVREAIEELRRTEEEMGKNLEDVREELHEDFVNDMGRQLQGPSLKDTKSESSGDDHDGETSENAQSSQSHIEGSNGTVYVVEAGAASEAQEKGEVDVETEEVGEEEHQEAPQAPEEATEVVEPAELAKVKNCITHPEHEEGEESQETSVPSESYESRAKSRSEAKVDSEGIMEEDSRYELKETEVSLPSETEETSMPANDKTVEKAIEPPEELSPESREVIHEKDESTLEQDAIEMESTLEDNAEAELQETGETDGPNDSDEESVETPHVLGQKAEEPLEASSEIEKGELVTESEKTHQRMALEPESDTNEGENTTVPKHENIIESETESSSTESTESVDPIKVEIVHIGKKKIKKFYYYRCENCGNEFSLQRRKAGRHGFCDGTCQAEYRKKSGWTHSREARSRISHAHKGRTASTESIEKRAKALKGRKPSDKTRMKISDAKKGKPGHTQTLETREKISRKLRGRVLSQETRQRISRFQTGRTHSFEHHQKVAAHFRGKRLTGEHRTKIGNSLRGKPLSDIHRAMMSAARGGNWIRVIATDRIGERTKKSHDIKKRDRWTCKACGQKKKSKEMHAHHIIPVKFWFNLKYYPDEWQVTLCSKCHRVTDAQKGFIKLPKSSGISGQRRLDEYSTE